MLRADGLAFLGELGAVLLAVAEDGDEAAGPAEEAINGPGGWSLLEKYGCFSLRARRMRRLGAPTEDIRSHL